MASEGFLKASTNNLPDPARQQRHSFNREPSLETDDFRKQNPPAAIQHPSQNRVPEDGAPGLSLH
ncbi:hypothetical protein D910_10192, partial [Dendroctonus ponderosae]